MQTPLAPIKTEELRAKDIIAIRLRLKLLVEQAASLIGVPKDLFEKFENSKSVPAKTTQELLRFFDKNPLIAANLVADTTTPMTRKQIHEFCANYKLDKDQADLLTAHLLRRNKPSMPPIPGA